MKKGKWIDISQPVHDNIAHWPEDIPFSYELSFTKKETGSVNIGRITTSLHTGTHVDAPFHFSDNGEKIIDLDINHFIGPCLVADVTSLKTINRAAVENLHICGAERLLLKTSTECSPNTFPKSVPCLTVDAVDFLKESDIKLLGVDVPSVDPLDSKELLVHHQLYKHKINILENVKLDHIKPGEYELAALPLPLKEGDGSPVRAALRVL
ncbi:arylformamidase [Alteribacillus sp. YIM 98480]|uniref:arylformamidase n=1 Tax=Alteribacillus sp. YIM 98480 TaxID=2606599 RepID=UPI00131AFE67|nr:arylformamidase [Alteribacillus sp. YIM 98480]